MIDRRAAGRLARRALLAAVALVVLAAVVWVLPPYPLVVWAFLAGAAAMVVAVGVAIWHLATGTD